MAILAPLSILLLLLHPSSSTSRKSLNHQPPHPHPHPHPSGIIKLPLHHVDSGKNLTKLQRLQHGLHRGKARLHRFDAMVLAASSTSTQLEAPVYAGTGAYLTTLSIGTPPLPYPAILDTGSDLVWTQCKPCSQCFHQPTPIFDPHKSSSFSKLPCTTDLCSALPSSACSRHACNYVYSYGDYSSTQGFLASETFTFGENEDNQVSVPSIGFGCGEDNEGDGFDQASGLVGLGRGPLSLISQLAEPRFSYCLTSADETDQSEASALFLGSFPSVDNITPTTTSLLTNPSLPSFYYLPLEGISVGDTRLDVDKSTFDIQKDGSGGVIIDSGTTITYLEQSAFEALKKEFVSQTNLPVDTSGSTGLDLCFSLPSDLSQVQIPKKLVFHFRSADLELPSENFVVGDSASNVACLAVGASSGLSIFGNIQQQNVLVNYDLEKETISFAPTRCDAL